MKNQLFKNEDNLEFLYDYKEANDLLDKLKLYIEICDDETLYPTGDLFSYKGIVRLWVRHIIEIAKEQYNNFKTGNFFSMAAMNRLLIENFVCFACIKKYRRQNIWKEWIISSHFMLIKGHDLKEEQLKLVDEFFINFGTTYEQVKKEKKIRGNYSWMRKVMPDKKQITFRDLCDEIDIPGLTKEGIYKDYKYMSDYVHTQNFDIKLYKFTFYENIFGTLFTMINYIRNGLILGIDKRSRAYRILMNLERTMNLDIAFLHNEILGKHSNIEKIEL